MNETPLLPADLDTKKEKAEAWFQALRDQICTSFESLEHEATGPFFPRRKMPAILCARRGSARIILAQKAAAGSCPS